MYIHICIAYISILMCIFIHAYICGIFSHFNLLYKSLYNVTIVILLSCSLTSPGGYRTALVERDGRVFFDRELFEHSRGSGTLAFLQQLLQSQSFERFVEERVTFAKYRKGFSDIFEKAVEASEEKHKGNVKHKVRE